MPTVSTVKRTTMVKLYRRSNDVLYVEYKVDGRTIQKSTRLKDTKQNRDLIKKEVIPALERKIIIGDLSGKKPKGFKYYSQIFLRDKQYLKSYQQIDKEIAVINSNFGTMRIDTITRGMVKDWVFERLKINSPKTVKDYLTQLRGVFMAAIDTEDIKDNPAINIPLPKHTKQAIEPFSSEEATKILSMANKWFTPFLAISFYTGMRTGEVLGLMMSDIDIKNKTIHIRRSISKGKITTPKTENSLRDVPILDELIPYLRQLPKTMWLFPKKDGTPYFAVSGQKKQYWIKLLKDCDIPYRKLYATRHTFIVSMLKHSDLSILEIAQIVGHSSTQMIIQNYGKFIKGEHLKIDRGIKLFTGISADSTA